MSDRRCTVEGCGRLHHARGLCARHYGRWYIVGDVQDHPRISTPPHSTPAECGRWVPGCGNGCPCFTVPHWRALAVAGQLPPLALAGGWHR